jgi:predicted SprT family Zn-dependent metalloprotease
MARRGEPVTAEACLQAAANRLLGTHRPALPPVTVRLSGRLSRSAGIYRPPGDITLSRHFLEQHGPEQAEAVLRHELAHHIVRWTVPGRVRPHGREFQEVAAALGAPRYAPAYMTPHTIYAYRCPACGWTWERRRRLPRGRRYACARCAPRYDDRFRLHYAGSWRNRGIETRG